MPKYISILGLLVASSLPAFADPMNVHGQLVDVIVESYRPAPTGMAPHAVHLKESRVFEFKNGLKIELKGRVLLHDNGNIWMAQGSANKAPVSIDIQGRSVGLNCSERPVVNGLTPSMRIVQFYPDGGYRLGCDVFGNTRISNDIADLEVASGSSLDLTADGDFSYAAKIVAGHINYRDQELELQPSSEVSFHSAAQPAFFTLKPGAVLKTVLPSGEEILVHGGSMNASITLDTQGRLEKGILAQDYVVPRLGYRLAKGSGVVYVANTMDKESPPYLSSVLLSEPVAMKLAGVDVKVNAIELSLFEVVKSVTTAEPFSFRPPENPSEVLSLPAGAKITMANSRRILKIEVSRARQ